MLPVMTLLLLLLPLLLALLVSSDLAWAARAAFARWIGRKPGRPSPAYTEDAKVTTTAHNDSDTNFVFIAAILRDLKRGSQAKISDFAL